MLHEWRSALNLFVLFQAQSDDDESDEVAVPVDAGSFMEEFFAQVTHVSCFISVRTKKPLRRLSTLGGAGIMGAFAVLE